MTPGLIIGKVYSYGGMGRPGIIMGNVYIYEGIVPLSLKISV